MGNNGFSRVDRHCGGCIFKTEETCDFYLRTGRRRAPICKAGKGCTVKSRDTDEYRRKWAALFPGTEAPLIAEERVNPFLGTRETVPTAGKRPTAYDLRRAEARAQKKAEALRLLREGIQPKEVAERLKATPMTIYNFRSELIAEGKLPPLLGQPVRIEKTNARELWEAGQTDKEIAAAVGVTPKSIARWRCKNGLKPN